MAKALPGPAPVPTPTSASPPTPPTTPTTPFSLWGSIVGLKGSVTGWYINVYLLVLAYLYVPIGLAAWVNSNDWYAAVLTVVLVSTLIDLGAIFYPWFPGVVSVAGFIAGQPGGEAGPSIKDGIAKSWDWLEKAYSMVAVTILGKQIILVALLFLPVRGFGPVALAILALIPLVIIGGVRFGSGVWVVKRFWHFYIAIIVALMGYWIIAGIFFPELRHSPAHSEVSSVKQTIRDQNDAYLKKEAEKIGAKMAAMPGHLTEAERVAKLSKEEQAMWHKANSSSFAGKSAEVVKAKAGTAGSAIGDAASSLYRKATGAAVSKGGPAVTVTTEFEKGFDPRMSKVVCGMPSGEWTYSVHTTPMYILVRGQEQQINAATPMLEDWALTLQGKVPGSPVKIGDDGCGKLQLDIPPKLKAFADQGEYHLSRSVNANIVLQ